MTLKRKLNISFIVLFLAFILAPLFDNIFHISPVKNLFENRVLSGLPKNPQTLRETSDYPRKFDNFFNDNYGFRKTLISINSWLMDNVFNQSPDNRAMIGKDGWLYFDNNNSLIDAQGLAKISDRKIEIAANSLIKNWHNLRAQNIDYLFVIAADKTSIYPEFLPDFIKVSRKNRRIDKLIKVLKNKEPNFPLIDLREILLEAKKNEVIYHKTDTHWNRRGAHYGYVEIMKKLGLDYNKRSEFRNFEDAFHVGDIAQIMNMRLGNENLDLRANFEEKWFIIKPTKEEKKDFRKAEFFSNHDENLPVLFVYKDSFFDNMTYFMAQHFSRSYFVNEFPCDLNIDVVQKYKSNIVIQQFWEGRIEEVVNKCKIK